MSLAGSCIKGSGVWEKRMGRQGWETSVGREGGGIIDTPAGLEEMVDQGKVLLVFGSEGFCVFGFNRVAKFGEAYWVEVLDLMEASGCLSRGGLIVGSIPEIVSVC
jgi:hypothetical protein